MKTRANLHHRRGHSRVGACQVAPAGPASCSLVAPNYGDVLNHKHNTHTTTSRTQPQHAPNLPAVFEQYDAVEDVRAGQLQMSTSIRETREALTAPRGEVGELRGEVGELRGDIRNLYNKADDMIGKLDDILAVLANFVLYK